MTTTNTLPTTPAEILMGLARFTRAKADHEAARAAAQAHVAIGRADMDAKGLWGEAREQEEKRLSQDPERVRLEKESTRTWEHLRSLERWPIAANLAALGLEDPIATAVVTVLGELDRTTWKRRVISVTRLEGRQPSELAGLKSYGIEEAVGVRHVPTPGVYRETRVEVEIDGQTVGSIDSDGRFAYRGAPDFRTIVGWFCATDLGRTGLLPADPMSAAEELREAVRVAGVSDETYDNVYRPLELQLFARDRLTRFGTVSGHFWSLLTRELGNEQPPRHYFS